MDSLAVWYLTIQLAAGGKDETFGPFTEAACVKCGETFYSHARAWQARGGPKAGHWLCIPVAATEAPKVSPRRVCSE